MDKKILLVGLIIALTILPIVVSVAPALPSLSVPAGLIYSTSAGVGTTGLGGGTEFPKGAEHPG